MPVSSGEEPGIRFANPRQLRVLCRDPLNMLIIPAIDLKDGRCVRLFQGEMDKETIYFNRPIDAARHWAKEGATFIHVVDLNGAVEGRPVHTREVESICNETGLS